jgi:hypothetical protein
LAERADGEATASVAGGGIELISPKPLQAHTGSVAFNSAHGAVPVSVESALAPDVSGKFQVKDKDTGKILAHKNYRIKTIDKLKCFYTNPTSLNLSKLIELSTIIAIENPRLIFITENWFNSLSVPALKNSN